MDRKLGWAENRREWRGRRAWLGWLLVGVVLCAGLATSPVVAEEVIPTEAPPPPTEAPPPPPPPTEPPPPPTAVPTEAPLPTTVPTDEPVELPPTEAPATDIPAVPPTDEPTSEPTVEPTGTPVPALAYALADQPDCVLADGQPDAIASGGALEYACAGTLHLQGSNVSPDGVTVTWGVRAGVDDGWIVQLFPPRNDPDEPVDWTPLQTGEAMFAFDQADPAGPGSAPGELDRVVEIRYRLRVTRPACAVTAQSVWLTHDVTVGSAEADPAPDPAMDQDREPLRLTPDLQPVPDPAVAFAGPLDFGEVSATSDGLSETTRTGILAVEIAGLDRTCGNWTMILSATTLTDPAGQPLAGSRLVVTAVDDVSLPDGGCDLAAGCAVLTLAGGPDAPATRTVVLTVALHMPEQAAVGAFNATLDAALRLAGADRAPESPQATRA